MKEYPNVHILDHPLIRHKVAMLRDVNTDHKTFRELVTEISSLLAYECFREVPAEKVSRYGIAGLAGSDGALHRLATLVEKPSPENAPSRLAIASRYVFTPDIFSELAHTPRGKGGEIQLTDAMKSLLTKRPMYGLQFDGRRYDIGNKLEFLKSTVEFGLRRPEFRDAFAAYLREIVKD